MSSNDELDPELAAALAEDDDSDGPPKDFETTDDEEAMDPAKLDAINEVRREVQQPRRKGGRPKGSRNKRPVDDPIVPQQIASADAPPPLVKPRPLDVPSIWEAILQRLHDRGMGGSDQVTIGVTQIILGPNREEPKYLNSIPGEAVGGGRAKTPGEDLLDYIEQGIHVPGNGGPAKYRLIFRLRGVARGGDSNLGVAEVTLPSAADIRKRWAAVSQLQRNKEREDDFGPMPPRPMRGPTWEQSPHPMGATPQAPQQMPIAALPTPERPQGMDPFAAQMFERVWDMYERERRLAQRLGEAPPPPPDQRLYGPPPAQPEANLEERVARTVAETLRTLGIIPQAVPQTPVAAPLTTPVVTQSVTAPMNAAKEFFNQMREFKKMEADMREMFAPEEEDEPPPAAAPAVATVLADPPEPDASALQPINEQFARFEGDPIMYGKQAEGESTWQWLARNALGNPKIAGKILEKGASMLDQSSFGKLVGAFTSMGGPQAQAARNLPGAVIDPGPQQANGSPARPGFTPNIG